MKVKQPGLSCTDPSSNVLNGAITQQYVRGTIQCMDASVCLLCDTILHAVCVYILPPPRLANSPFDPLWKISIVIQLLFFL